MPALRAHVFSWAVVVFPLPLGGGAFLPLPFQVVPLFPVVLTLSPFLPSLPTY